MAGCRQFGRMTNAELYSCMGICFQEPPPGQFRISNGTNILADDNSLLSAGRYFVISAGMVLQEAPMLTKAADPPLSIPVVLSTEQLRPRTISRGSPASQVVWPCPISHRLFRRPCLLPGFVAATESAKLRATTCLRSIISANKHVILSPAPTHSS